MIKKINSEIKFHDNKFKIKIGTIDKKNPDTIYIELGTYITPIDIKDSYNEDILNFQENTKKFFKNKIKTTNFCDSDNFITIFEVANERILFNKKSYIEIQLFLKNKKDFKQNKIFKTISKEIHDIYVNDSISYIENELLNSGFKCSKQKNK